MSNKKKNTKKKHKEPIKTKEQIKAEEKENATQAANVKKKAIIISAIALVLVAAIITTICLVVSGRNPLDKYTEDTSTEKKDLYYVALNIKDHGVIIVELCKARKRRFL